MVENNNNNEEFENENVLGEDEIAENYVFDDEEDEDVLLEQDLLDTDEYEEVEEVKEVKEDDTNEEKAMRKAKKKAKRSAFLRKAKIPFIVTLIVIVVAFTALYSYALSTITSNRTMNNVYVENINVSGLTYDETLSAINSAYLFENVEITLANGDKTFAMTGSDIGLTALPVETANKAFNYCKSGNFIIDGFNAIKLIFKDHVIVPAPQVDTALLDAKIHEFGKIVLGERKQHYVEYGDDGYLTIYSGQTGYNEDPTTARTEIMDALNREQLKGIHVSFASAPPDEMTLQSFDNLVYRDAIDARYEINNNEVTILPGQPGRFINKEEAAPFMEKVYEGCEPVRVPYYTAPPTATEQQLKDKLFANTLASYSTSYGGSTSNRRANVARAASLINGKVLAPGEVFSFNDTVGRRTTANGFYTAKEYINGKSVDGIGGGTCQVSSTLYSAVLYADMTIVERLNHMMAVGYIPLGQDATVSDSGVDFKFKNSSDYPVKISAYANGSTITVSIIGTQWEPARKVELSHSRSQSGKNTIVHSKRYVYANGELISTDPLNSSTYMPHEEEEKPTPAPAAATTTEEEDESTESTESTSTAETSSSSESSSESSTESSSSESSDSAESSEE